MSVESMETCSLKTWKGSLHYALLACCWFPTHAKLQPREIHGRHPELDQVTCRDSQAPGVPPHHWDYFGRDGRAPEAVPHSRRPFLLHSKLHWLHGFGLPVDRPVPMLVPPPH